MTFPDCDACTEQGATTPSPGVFTDGRTGRRYCAEDLEGLLSWEAAGCPDPEEYDFPDWLPRDYPVAAVVAAQTRAAPIVCPRCASPIFGLAVGGRWGPDAVGVCGCGHTWTIRPGSPATDT